MHYPLRLVLSLTGMLRSLMKRPYAAPGWPFLPIQMLRDPLCQPLGALLPDRTDSISIPKVLEQMTGNHRGRLRAL